MENASKALLIAGSILVAILLIAVGVSVYRSTQGTTDSVKTTMNATEIANFNGQFTAYLGENKSYAQVRSLLDVVAASNSTSIRKVTVSLGENKGGLTTYELPEGAGGMHGKLNILKEKSSNFSIFVGNSGYDLNGFIANIIIRTQV